MNNRKYIRYKKTWAAPGSELHKLLSEGKEKLAEKCYKETEEREKKLMDGINQRFPSKPTN